MTKLFSAAFLVFLFNFMAPMPASSDDTGLASALHSLKHGRGRVCMDGHYHYGSGGAARSKVVAVRSAIQDWGSFAAWEYGTDWANFNRAASRKPSCQQTYNGAWKCSVEARPCK